MAENQALRTRWMLLSIALVLFLAEPVRVLAQAVSEYQVKAAYVYNFAKFVDWPAESFTSPTAPIRLCVLNDRAFQLQLEQIVRGKNITGRPVIAISVSNVEESPATVRFCISTPRSSLGTPSICCRGRAS